MISRLPITFDLKVVIQKAKGLMNNKKAFNPSVIQGKHLWCIIKTDFKDSWLTNEYVCTILLLCLTTVFGD